MKASPLLVSWHNENAPIYSASFEPHGKGRLATAGGDNNVRLWKIEAIGEERKVLYLSTLAKHTQAVNVVRWCPRGETLASAGDDGNVLLWVPAENKSFHSSLGDEGHDDKETWRVKHMCRSQSGAEIYDLSWSPDGVFFITGSMDNVARIYNAQTGQTIRQIAEHNHYVQGVAWDPMNEFVATQSSDRSVHIYTLKTKDGSFSLAQHNKILKMDLPARRISSHSPAPADFGSRSYFVGDASAPAIGSPLPSAPGTPTSLAVSMNPPAVSRSRRSSFGSSPSIRRSVSPAPSLPLPAVMSSISPSLSSGIGAGLGVKNTNIYANEAFTSFFRRLTFAPDGSLLFTPAGQYKSTLPIGDSGKASDEVTNTVYIYTRAGLNKPPVAYLPGHKKPSLAVKCSPVYYTLRQNTTPTTHITVDTSSAEDEIPALPEPVLKQNVLSTVSSMDPPPFTSISSPSQHTAVPSPRHLDPESVSSTPVPPSGPPAAFGLPYRIIYAVATQDAVYVYDTQQQKPLCVVSNLHFATFTDLTWSNDGITLLMTSSDGFCSCLSFSPGELGQTHPGPIHPKHSLHQASNAQPLASSSTSTPSNPHHILPAMARQVSSGNTPSYPSPFAGIRPTSPARSMSASSITTQASGVALPDQHNITLSGPAPSVSTIPGVSASSGSSSMTGTGNVAGVPLFTPPQTPMAAQGSGGGISNTSGGGGGSHSATSSVSGITGILPKRESESERDEPSKKKQRNDRGPQHRKRESGSVAEDSDATKAESASTKAGISTVAGLVEERQGPAAKKRRVVPTLVTGDSEGSNVDHSAGELKEVSIGKLHAPDVEK